MKNCGTCRHHLAYSHDCGDCSSSYSRWQPKAEKSCFLCGSKGHDAAECHKAQQEQTLQNPALFPGNSGEMGASAEELPASPGEDVLPGRYPDDNPKTIHGLAKPSLSLIPGPALIEMARAFRHGADKYGPANWRDKPVSVTTYVDAAMRHLLAYFDGEDTDPESGCLHISHVMGCMAILADARAQGTLKDNRPTAGKSADLIREYTRPIAPN